MSDEIIINENPNINNINVNTITSINDVSVNTIGGVNSVNGKNGTVILSASDIGLGNVDNISDINKPISIATGIALSGLQNEINLINNIDTVISPLTGNWNNVYTNITTNSASYIFENIYANVGYGTIQQFAASNPQNIHKGYDITLINNRVYTFAGTDPTNPNHYLEINSNPITPIYQEINLNENQTLIDSFPLSDFKTAKYILQIETTFNNDIYYSELNVVASITTNTAVVSEYGQISTSNLILGYNAVVNVNDVSLYLVHNIDLDSSHQLIVKGSRTNHYKI
jgi:hypothetical protein